jgi:hypothetical protein
MFGSCLARAKGEPNMGRRRLEEKRKKKPGSGILSCILLLNLMSWIVTGRWGQKSLPCLL